MFGTKSPTENEAKIKDPPPKKKNADKNVDVLQWNDGKDDKINSYEINLLRSAMAVKKLI